jgi:hypothetical protein
MEDVLLSTRKALLEHVAKLRAALKAERASREREVCGMLEATAIRNWLGTYILVLTAVLGGYLLLAGGTWLLPLEPDDVTSSFEIVIPFLLSQVVIVFKFFAGDHPGTRSVAGMPSFFVKGPPLLATGLVFSALAVMATGGHSAATWTPSGVKFKAIVTFVVALLNASSAFVIAKYFESKGQAEAAHPPLAAKPQQADPKS